MTGGIANPAGGATRINEVGEPSDEALVAGLAAGDAASAQEFVRRWQSRAFGLARAILGDDGRAEDAAQEAFVRAWRYAAAFDPRRGSVGTWLLMMVRSAALDALRVERARPRQLMADVEMGPDPRDGPAEVAERGEQLAWVAERLRRLPEEQRRVLVLATIHGCTGREIAEREEIPLGTAKTRLRTALGAVRNAVEAHR